MITITVLALPPSVNHMYVALKGGKKALGPEAEIFRKLVLAEVLADRPTVPDGPLAFTMRLTFGDRRKTDLDNRLKACIDAVALALRFDDSRIERIVAERLRCDPGLPRCELTIEEA